MDRNFQATQREDPTFQDAWNVTTEKENPNNDAASDDQDQSHESEGGEKNATAAQEGSKRRSGKERIKEVRRELEGANLKPMCRIKPPAWTKHPTHGAKSGTHPWRMLEDETDGDISPVLVLTAIFLFLENLGPPGRKIMKTLKGSLLTVYPSSTFL
ncbi:hypothetical protein NDU88_003940 [Pleurodeles waltl]|uniref:Uncharacterized protein n=1 Tax=Pleurodeles waltl TaxID=8319 RepID=A0AAV7MTZ0_PLEWA|nr:hypothetical protein NDU88_003940 [Pleurodeles waltl]